MAAQKVAIREFSFGTRLQQEWGWLVIIDLFLNGMGAGLFTIALLLGSIFGMIAGLFLVLVGGLMLLRDLTRPQAAWRIFIRPQSSWVSRGVFGITGFAIFAVVNIVSVYLLIQTKGWAVLGEPWTNGSAWMILIAVIAGAFAIFVATYPGFLLGGMRAIPLWCSAYTPALFLVSSLLGGLGVIYLIPFNLNGIPWVSPVLLNTGLVLVVFELLIILGLIGQVNSETSKESVLILTKGTLLFHFWVGLFGLGLIVPLIILMLIALGVGSYMLPVAGVFLIVGMLLVRYTITKAGVYPSIV